MNQKASRRRSPASSASRRSTSASTSMPGTVYATLQDLDTMRVDFSVPEQEIRLVAIGHAGDASRPRSATPSSPARSPRSSRGSTRNSRLVTDARRGREPRRARSIPASSCGCGSSCREEANVIALPQTVLSSNLYGNSVFVVRTEGEGDAAEQTVEQVFVKAGRRSQGLVEIVEGVAARRPGGDRRAEPADGRRDGRRSTTPSTRVAAPAARTRGRGDALLRALHPPAGALDRARRLHPAARLPGHLQPRRSASTRRSRRRW